MKQFWRASSVIFVIFLTFFLFIWNVSAAETYDLKLIVSKAIYGPGETIELYGYLNTTSNTSVANKTVVINITNSSYSVADYTFNTSSDGTFHSRSDYYPNATLVSAPNVSGNYSTSARYRGTNETVWEVGLPILVVDKQVDEITIEPDSVIYYGGARMNVTVRTTRNIGDSKIPVSDIRINGTVRNINDTILSSFNCTTDSNGLCMVGIDAPSTSGSYILEANDFIGYTSFKVVPFDVSIFIKDDSATYLKEIFKKGDDGYVEVIVSYNSTQPSGAFTVSGNILNSNGSVIKALSSFELNANNSYTNRVSFSIDNNFTNGMYVVSMTISQSGGESVSSSVNFQVKDWTLSFSKASLSSGFEYGYTAFGNTTIHFEAFPIDRSSGSVLTGLENNFTIVLRNNLGIEIDNSTAVYNSSCECYKFNLTAPNTAGSYRLSVTAVYNRETLTFERVIKVTDIYASAIPTDVNGKKREVFGTSEFVYLTVSAKNRTSDVDVADIEIASIVNDAGAESNYTQADNWSVMNLSDSTLEWSWNSSVNRLKIDSPPQGGLYLVTVYVNNRTAQTVVRFLIKSYEMCISPKASSDTSQSDYYWQFKTSDTIYLQITVNQAQDLDNLTVSGVASNGSGYGYGMGRQCSFDTSKKKGITNATLSVNKVVNSQSGKQESLNRTASTCEPTDNNGGYICTLKPEDNKWDGGNYYVVVDVTGPDGVTKDRGYGMFEARAFYLYGWSQSWRNKPNSTITFTINMYSAGNGWWSSGNCLEGTVELQKVEYHGKPGEWIWPAVKYNYNTSKVNVTTISSSQCYGSMSLPASGAPNGSWDAGSYTAVIKGTDSASGDVDYGQLWFEVRNWEVYATPVEIQGNDFRYKYQFNTRENISLYVKISNAGDYWSSSGSSLGGNVTISIQKLQYYTTWPPKVLEPSNYTANTITVNVSNKPYWYSGAAADYPDYIINISPTSGRWDSGYYQVVLDVNGTETGWGWFSSMAFYIETRPVDENGSYMYATRGRGPMYFNVTTTKNYKGYGYATASDYVNTTIEDIVLRTWKSDTWEQIEYRYPDDINISLVGRDDLRVNNGQGVLNITFNSGNWQSGYYSGEIKLKNDENESVTGWLWFSVEPFRVSTSATDYTISPDSNVTASLYIYEPDWRTSTVLSGNYTITRVYMERWDYSGRHITNITDYSPSSGETFNGTATVRIKPNTRWTSGWNSLRIRVKDVSDNSTKDGWLSFRAVPFTVTPTRTSPYNIGLFSNVTVNFTLQKPVTNELTAGNLTSVYYWGWPSKTYYDFIVDGCDSRTSDSCLINSSGGTTSVTIIPPENGWEEGYHYMYFTFTEHNDSSSRVEDWSSVYFYARPAISGYMYTVNSQGGYQWGNAPEENVTLYLYSVRDINDNAVTVNITNVQYAESSSGCWTDSCRTYVDAVWNVVNLNGSIISGNQISGSGYIRLYPPNGLWEYGDYYVKIFLTNGTESVVIKNGYFKIKDMVAPVVTVLSPDMGQVVNTSSVLISANTTEDARCDLMIINQYNYYSWYCGGNTTGACNTSHYNGTSYYYRWVSGWGYDGLTTGGTLHSYNLSTSALVNQDYVARFYCYDSDWNYGYGVVVFRVNVTTSPSVTVIYPNGGEIVNGSVNVRVNVSDPSGVASTLNISYTKGNASAVLINSTSATNGLIIVSWNTSPLQDGNDYRIVATVTYNSNITSDTSDDYFTINNSDTGPVANIDASPTEGNAPLTVNFTGNFSGGNAPFTYFWNFADSNNSTLQNVSHTFTSAGSYNVSFTVNDTDGDADTDYVLITVNAATNLTNGTQTLSLNEFFDFSTGNTSNNVTGDIGFVNSTNLSKLIIDGDFDGNGTKQVNWRNVSHIDNISTCPVQNVSIYANNSYYAELIYGSDGDINWTDFYCIYTNEGNYAKVDVLNVSSTQLTFFYVYRSDGNNTLV
jgi:hypothetical protein